MCFALHGTFAEQLTHISCQFPLKIMQNLGQPCSGPQVPRQVSCSLPFLFLPTEVRSTVAAGLRCKITLSKGNECKGK